MESIFPLFSLDRNKIHWEDYLYNPTPIEEIGQMSFKREDKFAPLGYGGVNGSKLRQCIWLIHEYVKNSPNPTGIISGTSVKSPQLPIGSSVATHFGLKSIHIIGATKTETSIKHPNVELATWFGALFNTTSKVGYNPVLQKRVKDFLKEDKKLKDYFYLEYGITVDHRIHPASKIEQFHKLGAEQLKELPDHIEDIVISAGSYNSMASVLYGVAKYRPKNLKNIHILGIGPNRLPYVEDRMQIISDYTKIDLNIYKRNYFQYPEISDNFNNLKPNPDFQYNLFHYDLHKLNYTSYQDEKKFFYEGVEFHPTYEGKTMNFIKEHLPNLWSPKTLYWIVGSKNRKESMEKNIKDVLGNYPNKIIQYNNFVK